MMGKKKNKFKRKALAKSFLPLLSLFIVFVLLQALLPEPPSYPVWSSAVPDQMAVVQGTDGSVFIVPEEATRFQTVKSTNRMTNIDNGYALRGRGCAAYVLRNRYAVEEVELKGQYTEQELVDDIETVGHIRILDTAAVASSTRPYRKITKTIYTCRAEALYNAEYFNSYSGYLSIIKKDDVYKILFAGVAGGTASDALGSIVRSHQYREYALPAHNEGTAEQETEETSSLKSSKVNPGMIGKAGVTYRDSSGAHTVNIGVTMTDIFYIDTRDLRKALINAGNTECLPPKEDEGPFVIAEFKIDGMGRDMTSALPFIRVRVSDTEGDTAERGTYILSQTDTQLKVFFKADKDKDLSVKVGNTGLRIDCRPRTVTKGE